MAASLIVGCQSSVAAEGLSIQRCVALVYFSAQAAEKKFVACTFKLLALQ